MEKPTALDIFSGGGGLTVGLKRAGFNVAAAIEIESSAFATYKSNHPEVQVYKQDVRTIKGDVLRRFSPTGTIDLLSCCPPCQGFSSLTSKYRREDPRNDLVLEMARLVMEIKPRSVMMENVPGLIHQGKHLFDGFVDTLTLLGYLSEWAVLQVADYGVPQSRRRLVLLAGRGFRISLPSPTHSRTGNKELKPWRTLKSAIGNMPKPITLEEAWGKGGPQFFDWHVVRTLSPQNVRRLAVAKPGKAVNCLPNYLRPNCHKGKQGGFSNVYGRAAWNQPSPTITAGCTTLSKGRFGHPVQNRTISVREAALIQTFPQDYIFDTPYMDHVCNIIGNALPCNFAELLGKQCIEALRENK